MYDFLLILPPPLSFTTSFSPRMNDLPVLQLHCSTPSKSFHLFSFRYLFIYLFIHPSIYSFIIFLSLVRPHPHDASIIRRNNLRRHHDANEDSLGLKRPSLLTAYAFFIIGRVRSRSASTWDTFSEAAFPVSLFADVYIYTTTGRH